MKHRQKPLKPRRRFLENFLVIGVVVPLLFFLLVVISFVLLKDTIAARGAIIWYTSSRGAVPNYVLILMLIFLWWGVLSALNLLPRSFSLRYDGYPKPIDKEELRTRKAEEIWASLSSKERAVQVQMDQHVNNILFAGYVPECPTDGRFICFSCHHEWTASVRQVYKPKACGQCGVSYRKVDV